MRPIKFKCWDGTKMWKHAVPLHSTAYNGGTVNVSDNEDGTFNKFVIGELLQFTGLLDRNGKEVYEGDILKRNHFKFTVIFGISSTGTHFGYDISIPYSECEIIGNIYETPI